MEVEIQAGRRVVPMKFLGSTHGAGCEQCVFGGDDPGCQQAKCTGREEQVYFTAAPEEAPEPLIGTEPEGGFPAGAVPGRKDDGGKLDLTLLFDDCPHALEAVAEVLQWAVTKKQPVPYARGSWQGVSDFQRRYRAAQLRHQMGGAKAVLLGGTGQRFEDQRDAETGLRELAHIATDAIFQLEMAIRREKGIETP